MALDRGITIRPRLASEEGGSISLEEAAYLLGISKADVLKRHRIGRLLAWHGKRRGGLRFPDWQFDGGRLLLGIIEVLEILNRDKRLEDWGKALFFLQTRSRGRGL